MDLWIKSQDKLQLAKIVNLKIERTTIKGNTKVDDWEINLGTYKTKERALEVLDEIQNIIHPVIKYEPLVEEITKPQDEIKKYKTVEMIRIDTPEIVQLDTYVYQMPKE